MPAGTVVDRVVEEGRTLELIERDGVLEVLEDGRRLMASDARGVESTLAELAIEIWRGRDDISVLVAGLGKGFATRAALDQPGVCRVDVVEASPAIIRWEEEHFRALNGGATADPRAHVHRGELGAFLQAARIPDQPPDGWFVLLLDIDEHPARYGRPGNAVFYTDEGLDVLRRGLRPGGVLGIWTTQRDDELTRRLHRRMQAVSRVAVPGHDGLDYIYRARLGPRRSS